MQATANGAADLAVMDVNDLAKLFRVSRDSIENWVNQGRLPTPLPLPGRKRWSRVTIERFLQGEGVAA